MKCFINSERMFLFAGLSADMIEKDLVTVQVWLDGKTAFEIGMMRVREEPRDVSLLPEDADTDQPTFSSGGIAGAPEHIFCVDGNSSGAAGVAEMLLQSRGGKIKLPPARANGSVRGLRARGGATGNIEWLEGKVSRFRLHSPSPQPVKV